MTEEHKPNTVTFKKEKFDVASNCLVDVTEVTITSSDDMKIITEEAMKRFNEIK